MILIQINRICDLKPYFYYALEQYALNHLLKQNPEKASFLFGKSKEL
ncbi:hypothetical protein ACEW7V_01815 [Areca yellow leaf disease phytoplasma]